MSVPTRDLLIPAIAELRRPRLYLGYLLRHLGVPLLLLGLALRFFSLHRRAFLVQLLLGLYLDLALYLPGRIGRDIRAEPDALFASLGEHLPGAGIGVERYCPSVLAPSRLGVIATALSVNAATSIDSATVRIVRLIIVLPGLSYPRRETLAAQNRIWREPFLRRQQTVQCGTKSASSLRGRRNLGRNRYDMMRRLLRTREFLRDEASKIRRNSQLGRRAGRDSTQVWITCPI